MKPTSSLLRAAAIAALVTIAPQAMAEPLPFVVVAESQTPDPQGDILDVAAAAGQFQTFLHAVEVAGYEETLRGEGPLTVFAPTDEAFSEMDQAELRRLMAPEQRDELLALLAYHVVPERVTTESVHGHVVRPKSSNGYRIEVDGRDGLRVNDQLVAVQDLEASNGVVQGINAVLAPPVLVASAGTSR